MLGSPQRPGLYALAGRDIFAQLGQSLSEPSVTKLPEAPLVFLSFFEIYCGQLYDLLDHRKRLFAREDQHHVVQIVGLREVMVDCVDNLLEVISCGSRERRQGASGVNCDSSRSHALLQIHLRDSKHQLIGRISFVDLAGSERAADTRKPDRQNRIEGAEINQSLLALKECIRALDQEHMHPPFRQSKLTQVLKDSFIGNSKTCMIANISPSHLATEHTLNTLRYADRVKELKKGNTNLLNPPTANSKYSDGPSPKLSKNKMEKSPLKKVRSGGYTTGIDDCFPASSPLRIEFPFADALLCSTPKFATEEKHHEQKGEVFLDHTTPVRGTLRNGMSKHSKELGKRWVAKGTKNNVGHYLKGSAKNAEQATKQSGEHEVQESICWKKLEQRFLLEEKFPGERDVHDIIKTKKDKLMDKREKNQNQDQDRWEEYQKVRQKEETEAVKHLRRYHQQLQKLPYPPASLSGRLVQQTLADLVGMNKCVVQSQAVNRGTAIHTSPKITPVVWVGEDKDPTNNLCKDRLETDKVWCSRSSRQTIMTVWETKDCLSRGVIPEQILSRREESAEVTGSSQESSSSYQLDFSGYAGTREMLEQNGLFASRWAMLQGKMERLDVDKQESGGAQVPTICRTVDDLTFERLQLPAREESDSWEGEGEGMVQSNTYGLSKWSIEEECNGAWNTCDLSESSNGSSNVLAEKPLSSFIYKTLLNPEDHGNVSLDHEAVSHGVQDGLCTRDLHDTSDIPSYPLLRGNINSHEPSCSCSSDKVQIAGWMKGIQCIASAQGVETGPLFSSEVFPLGQASSEADAYGSPDAETEKGSQELKEIKGDAYSRAPLNIPQITSDNSTDTSTCSNTTMGPLSISLLDVERQAATDSIFQHDCSPLCNSVRERKEEGVEEEAPLFFSDAARGVNYSKSAVKLKGQTRHQWSFMDPSLLNGNSLETAAQHGGKVHSDPTVCIGVTHKQDYSPAKKVQVDLCREMVALEFAQDVDLLKQHAATSIDGFPCAGSPGASGNVGKVSNWDSSNAVHISGVGLEKLVSDTSSRKAVLADQVLKDGCLEEPLHSPRQDSAWLSCAASSHSESIMSAAEPNTALLCKTKLGEARRFVVQAHCEQLAKMELLCRREEALLSMQPNMDFNDYVLMLEEIMELQSQCVHSMRLQLDLYLTSRAQPSHTA
ncbi:kinesin-like protein KIF24 [Scleropages formosus]|nr:kinesin-like protein KIF24 [Scleropages formosus]